ncbi:MAG: hypothetical protein KF833_06995 [Verrucomicrobiae bacterium]|nr:hypothetical protein [Verrucomicrobiae bacterium]
MSFKSLLPLGRSFTPSEGRPGRYRPPEPGALPRLDTASAGTSAGVAPGRAAGREGEGVGRGRARSGRRLPLWVEQLVLAVLRPGNRRRGTREVQGELDLRLVKVVRNDLETADMEVVVRPEGSGRPGLSPACRGRVLRLWWEQGMRRIRRIGNALF